MSNEQQRERLRIAWATVNPDDFPETLVRQAQADIAHLIEMDREEIRELHTALTALEVERDTARKALSAIDSELADWVVTAREDPKMRDDAQRAEYAAGTLAEIDRVTRAILAGMAHNDRA